MERKKRTTVQQRSFFYYHYENNMKTTKCRASFGEYFLSKLQRIDADRLVGRLSVDCWSTDRSFVHWPSNLVAVINFISF